MDSTKACGLAWIWRVGCHTPSKGVGPACRWRGGVACLRACLLGGSLGLGPMWHAMGERGTPLCLVGEGGLGV